MDYRESLAYLYGLRRFGIKLGLENSRTLLARLGRPDRSCPIVQVAGTNGKGSVCAFLEALLRQAGYRVGLYTSPHLQEFSERIRVAGRKLPETDLGDLVERVRRAAAELPITFFEAATAMALLYFRDCEVDLALLEVGMGGRLDATTAASADLTLITSICSDHIRHLGKDLAAIAGEKAGIIRRGVPVIVAAQEPAALAVIEERARALQAPLWVCGRDFAIDSQGASLTYRGLDRTVPGLQPGLLGEHQHQNLALALAAAEVLQRRRGVKLESADLRRGAAGARWPGRLEWWRDGREVLLDGAHNEGGAQALASYLDSLPVTGIRWVAAVKDDKDPAAILDPVLPRVHQVYCTVPGGEAGRSPQHLAQRAAAAGKPARAFAAPEEALAAALAERRPDEVVLVAGSLFLVGLAREFLASRKQALG